MKKPMSWMVGLVTGTVLGAGVATGGAVVAASTGALPLEDLRVFADVFGKIKSEYVESVEDKSLLRNAISGMLSGLDPHSTYLDAESFKEVRIGTEGRFGGLGIEVTTDGGFLKVVAPIDDTPASEAGIEAGDIITQIDGKTMKDLPLGEAVKLMRGEPGSEIVVTVVREGEDKPLDFTMNRAVIKVTSVKSRFLDDGYGYVRITQFQSGTTDSLRKALNRLKEKNGENLQGLVLDLRNNPGGVLNGAVGVSDAFLTEGDIVFTRGRGEDSQLKFSATSDDLIDGAPLVVLVNPGSASASEIVAGALQDHKRAVIMGEKTFGKGSVQTILPMSNGAALKITTARYYTPSDRSIQATGIEPDIQVANLELAKTKSNERRRLREADLSGHLTNEKDKKKAKLRDDRLDEDFQLREALNLLKGLNVVKATQKS